MIDRQEGIVGDGVGSGDGYGDAGDDRRRRGDEGGGSGWGDVLSMSQRSDSTSYSVPRR